MVHFHLEHLEQTKAIQFFADAANWRIKMDFPLIHNNSTIFWQESEKIKYFQKKKKLNGKCRKLGLFRAKLSSRFPEVLLMRYADA